MAWSALFSAKKFVKNVLLVGKTRPLSPKPLFLDLWVAPSGDGMNIPLTVYDKDSASWQRDAKVIVSAADPGSSANLLVTNEIRVNDLWVTPGVGSGSVVKVYTGNANVTEVQSVVATGASAGDFTLSFMGEPTATPIAYNAAATGVGSVQAGLLTLSTVGASGVTCTGGPLPTTPVIVTFADGLTPGPRDLLVANSTGLTGGTAVVSRVTAGLVAWK